MFHAISLIASLIGYTILGSAVALIVCLIFNKLAACVDTKLGKIDHDIQVRELYEWLDKGVNTTIKK